MYATNHLSLSSFYFTPASFQVLRCFAFQNHKHYKVLLLLWSCWFCASCTIRPFRSGLLGFHTFGLHFDGPVVRSDYDTMRRGDIRPGAHLVRGWMGYEKLVLAGVVCLGSSFDDDGNWRVMTLWMTNETDFGRIRWWTMRISSPLSLPSLTRNTGLAPLFSQHTSSSFALFTFRPEASGLPSRLLRKAFLIKPPLSTHGRLVWVFSNHFWVRIAWLGFTGKEFFRGFHNWESTAAGMGRLKLEHAIPFCFYCSLGVNGTGERGYICNLELHCCF